MTNLETQSLTQTGLVEVSGWDEEQIFFVERSELGWDEVAGKTCDVEPDAVGRFDHIRTANSADGSAPAESDSL